MHLKYYIYINTFMIYTCRYVYVYVYIYIYIYGAWGGVVVKALRY